MAFSGPLEDRLALRDLLDSYADAVCRNDGADWAATWVEACRWDLAGFGELVGKSAVVETWTAAMRGFPGLVFQAWPGAMTVAGDTATMRSYTCETYWRDGEMRRDFGEYADQCAKIDGRWYFVSRQFRSSRRSESDT
ncbi:DUF4440 domain-containing protein [Sphingopyxis sp. QXT-31]|uniref:nuclear transport factor 2 family protein n=1 Tax=Sphingopyxis sp. QXT-31 TaxID=1357916 RepID=UPI0009796574|nr:nuclear transport factor 2 family protein [Sphingopyxis sp. QXT-31]APZ99948.1 DUF4440 domain-containing protein [Sphingopyxis sp. QXT-31]